VQCPDIVIVTPALADANNGNWQTARRWASLLRGTYNVRLASDWHGGDEALLIALHARRSASSVAAWRARHPRRPLIVALTGTDLYRDIAVDDTARAALEAADRLIVLNELGKRSLPHILRAQARVILQSCPAWRRLDKTAKHLRAVMVGHLREEKSPGTYFEAARMLASRPDILLDHVGAALDPQLGLEAAQCMQACPRYRWLGGLPHALARRRIQGAHVLVHPSRMEGGAHVVIEAVRSGTPVLASRIDGNVGLLGEDYAGYFAVGDAAGLAALLQRVRDEPSLLTRLQQQCAERSPLFDPGREADGLRSVVRELLEGTELLGDRAPPSLCASIDADSKGR
jgi:putative glycosyltransferase (TIGR04348 family)